MHARRAGRTRTAPIVQNPGGEPPRAHRRAAVAVPDRAASEARAAANDQPTWSLRDTSSRYWLLASLSVRSAQQRIPRTERQGAVSLPNCAELCLRCVSNGHPLLSDGAQPRSRLAPRPPPAPPPHPSPTLRAGACAANRSSRRAVSPPRAASSSVSAPTDRCHYRLSRRGSCK